MPQVSLDQGDVEKLVTLDRYEAVQIQPKGGDIRFDRHRSSARRGQLVEDREIGTEIALSDNESLYVHGESDGVTVDYRIQGFLDFRFPKANINVQTESVRSRIEVNADQTENLGTNASQTSTITANSGELWKVDKIYLEAPDDYTSSSSSQVISWTVQTEEEGVIVGYGDVNTEGGGVLPGLAYRGGDWVRIGSGSSFTAAENTDIEGTVIDDDSGLQIIFETSGVVEDSTSTRKIRVQFAVTQV